MGTKTEKPSGVQSGSAKSQAQTEVDVNISVFGKSARGCDRVIFISDHMLGRHGVEREEAAWIRDNLVRPAVASARAEGSRVMIDLDGARGYASAFLDELFAGLVREFGRDAVERTIVVKSDAEPYLVGDIQEYIAEAAAGVG